MSRFFRSHASLAVLFFMIVSCSGPKEAPLPAGILGKDKMVAVLVDIHLAEASADNRNLNVAQINSLMTNKYDSLFRHHGITSKEFLASYNYYLEHADLLSPIYAEVVNQLTTGESRVNAGRKTPPVLNDSIRNAMADSLPKN